MGDELGTFVVPGSVSGKAMSGRKVYCVGAGGGVVLGCWCCVAGGDDGHESGDGEADCMRICGVCRESRCKLNATGCGGCSGDGDNEGKEADIGCGDDMTEAPESEVVTAVTEIGV